MPRAFPRPALSAFTRVHSPSKTGVNALRDALWRGEGAEPRSGEAGEGQERGIRSFEGDSRCEKLPLTRPSP